MDGFKVGDRLIGLENSVRYGLQRWERRPLRPKDIADGIGRLWVEIETTEEEKDFDRMESALWWADNPTWERTKPITQQDIDKYNLPQESLDGCAVFPKVENINISTPEGRARAAKQQSDWEKRSIQMHDQQQPLPTLADKPEDTGKTGKYFSELKRGD